MPDVALWGYGLASAAYLIFALYLVFAWRGGRPGGMLIAAVGCSALWAAANALLAVSAAPSLYQVAALLDVVRYAGWYAFLLVLLVPLGARRARWPIAFAAAVLAVQCAAVILSGFDLGTARSPASLLLASSLAAAVFGLVLLEQLYRGLPTESRWGFKPLCLGLAAGFIFELYLFADGFLFGRIDADVWAVRGIAHSLVIPLVAMSAARIPSWTLRIAVSREMVFHSTALAVSGAYLLVIAAAGYYVRYFGGDWGRAMQLALLFAGLLLLGVFVFSASQRARLRVLINKHLFPYRYDYRREWMRFTQALGDASELELGQSVIKALADLVESPGGLLWLRDAQGRFAMHARLNHPPSDAVEHAGSSLCRFLDEREWVVDLEEYRARRRRYEELELPDWLSQMNDAWLVIPLSAEGSLVGFVVLNSPRTAFEINWEVLDLLKSAQRQAASYLSRMLTAEALLEARKFDSFNRMSAFVVHDLKNLVAQLSLMLKNAERHRNNPAFQEDMLETVAHVEARMRSLMTQLQEKRSIDPARSVDLRTVVERIRTAKRMQRPPVEVNCGGDGALEVFAHPERLERVIGHLVQNALDATPEDGKVAVRLDRTSGHELRLEIEDSGCGMSTEFMRERLLKPFQTTKRSGMGIGVYETQQYVRELGGAIRFESEQGKGTCVSLTLPLAIRGAHAQSLTPESTMART